MLELDRVYTRAEAIAAASAAGESFGGRIAGALFFAGKDGDGDVLLTRPGRVEWRFRGDPHAAPDAVEMLLPAAGGFVYVGRAKLVLLERHPSTGDVDADYKLLSPSSAERWIELKRGGKKKVSKVTPPKWAEHLAPPGGDQREALAAFLAEWRYMKPAKKHPDPPPGTPAALAMLDRCARGDYDKFRVQNRLLSPSELERGADGRTVFYVENQGVCRWAFLDDGDDPSVEVSLEDGGWLRQGERLSGFLLQVAMAEALFEGFGFAAWSNAIDPATADAALAPIPALPLGEWTWPAGGTRFHASKDAIAFRQPAGSDVAVWILARKARAVAHLRDLASDDWHLFEIGDAE